MSQKPKQPPVQDNPHKNKIMGFIILGFIVVGILLFNYYQDLQARAIGNVFSNSVQVINTTDTPTTTPDEVNATQTCYWNWATNNAKSEHIDALIESLDSAGIEDYEVVASAYGEDKICQVDDEIVSSSFHMMDISPSITLTVDSTDTSTLSDHIRTIVTALEANDALPKINRIEILFTDDSDSILWTTTYSEVTQAIANNMNDDDLFGLGQG